MYNGSCILRNLARIDALAAGRDEPPGQASDFQEEAPGKWRADTDAAENYEWPLAI
jgi:hypothetical protein